MTTPKVKWLFARMRLVWDVNIANHTLRIVVPIQVAVAGETIIALLVYRFVIKNTEVKHGELGSEGNASTANSTLTQAGGILEVSW